MEGMNAASFLPEKFSDCPFAWPAGAGWVENMEGVRGLATKEKLVDLPGITPNKDFSGISPNKDLSGIAPNKDLPGIGREGGSMWETCPKREVVARPTFFFIFNFLFLFFFFDPPFFIFYFLSLFFFSTHH